MSDIRWSNHTQDSLKLIHNSQDIAEQQIDVNLFFAEYEYQTYSTSGRQSVMHTAGL